MTQQPSQPWMSSSSTETGNESQDQGVTQKVQDKASEYSGKLQDQADAGIDRAAQGLEQAAEQMRSRVEGQGGIQGQVGTKMADSLEKTAGYLREHEADEIWHDVEQYVKDHPLQAAASAAVAGFLFARILK